jgi:hypothetical protein
MNNSNKKKATVLLLLLTVFDTQFGVVIAQVDDLSLNDKKINPPQQMRDFIKTRTLGKEVDSGVKILAGRVLDPAIVTPLILDWHVAELALRASHAEYQRTKVLFTGQMNASKKALELAEVTWQRDQAIERSLYAKMTTTFGINLLAKNHELEFVNQLIDGSLSLIEIDLPEEMDPRSLRPDATIFQLGNRTEQSHVGKVVSSALARDPVTRLSHAFVLLIGQPFLIGTLLEIKVETPKGVKQAFSIPRSALLYNSLSHGEDIAVEVSDLTSSFEEKRERPVLITLDTNNAPREVEVEVLSYKGENVLIQSVPPAVLTPEMKVVVTGGVFLLTPSQPNAEEEE